MKKILFTLLLTTSLFSVFGQRIQATLKPGTAPRSVDIYLKSSSLNPSKNDTARDDAMTFVLAIPKNVLPKPSVATQSGLGSAGTTANGLGAVAGISGLQPTFLVNNLGCLIREVYLSLQPFNADSSYFYTFLFSGTAFSDRIWVPNVEQLMFTIQFNGCNSNCLLNPQLVSLPNGGPAGRDYFYFQARSIGDITNSQAPFYQNPQSAAPLNGGSYATLSTLALAAPVSLPIKLTSFDAKAGNCNVGITWTAIEENSSAFYGIEASKDGTTFKEIARVNASADNIARSYVYEDNFVEMGKLYYRLRLVQKDGSFTYSAIKEININCSGNGTISVYPTITRGPVKITLPVNLENAVVRIYNSMGKQVLSNSDKERNRSFDLSSFASGTYLVNIFGKEKTVTTKVVKQ